MSMMPTLRHQKKTVDWIFFSILSIKIATLNIVYIVPGNSSDAL